ncbi:zinc finger and BTB domain containing protein [Rhypophila sp. PSN 637]
MAAIPIQAPSRYGPRDFDNGPLPSISRREESFSRQPFGASSRHMPFPGTLSPAAASNPMSIRGSDNYCDAPPPLPPPRLVPIAGPIDPAVQRNEYMQRHDDYSSSEASDSFGLDFKRRDLSFKSNFPDEGYQSMESSYRPSVPSPFGMMNSFRPDSIDNSMLSKLNRPARRSGLSASVNDAPTPRLHHTHLNTISLPDRSKSSFFDSGFTKSPVPMSAISPRHTPFSQLSGNHRDYRSPVGTEAGDSEHSPALRTRRLNSGSVADDATVSTQCSFEGRDEDVDFPMEETSRMRGLRLEDQWREREREREREYYQAGQKRRASSPLGDDAPMASDLLRRRDGGILSRGSPTPRLTVIPQGSVSSISSASRSNSYVSNLTASSMTSIGSFGRRSPNALSPGGLSPTDPMSCSSPFATPISLTASPRSAIGRSVAAQQPHQRTLSEHAMAAQGGRTMASPRKLQEIPKNPSSLVAGKLKGPYMCECCPKKPKKFDSEEELKLHEAEKQYECSYCGNRFKNKNEAERHQNSLHVRRHSWSCSALTGYDRAFHDSTTRPGEADTCGYCGDEFPRTGRGANGAFINEQDWEERARHLQDIHKFRECNSSKKFFRADHFRQHLKHSHAGTSGKWTNMLENACMMEEDPPVPR